MWFAILVTLLAATGNNIGKALQKEAVHSLPRFSVQPAILRYDCLRSIPRILSTSLQANSKLYGNSNMHGGVPKIDKQ